MNAQPIDTTDDDSADQMLQARADVQQEFAGFLKEAWDARLLSGIEEEWRLAEDLYAGVDPDSGEKGPQAKNAPSRDGRSRMIINITEAKVLTAASQIERRVLPADRRPWAIRPTPVPEFGQAINEGSDAPVRLQSGETAPASQVAQAASVMLARKAERMTEQIEDWLTDPGLYNHKTGYAELREMIHDGARVGTGVLKAPFPQAVTERRWTKVNGIATISAAKRIKPKVRCISVANCYPDPSCGEDIHAGSYFIERDYLTARQVRELRNQPGYEDADLATVLKQGPQAFSQWDDRYKDERQGQTMVSLRKTFEVFYLYAEMSVEKMVRAGFNVPAVTVAVGVKDGATPEEVQAKVMEQIEAAMSLEAAPIMATMINGRIVKLVLNPDEKGRFPYGFFRWVRVKGRPYGKGAPIQMATPQLLLTAAARAMVENAGQSAGSTVVYADVVTPVTDGYRVGRNTVFKFTPSETIDDVRKAFALFTVPSVQEQLFNIVKAAQEWADQLTNIQLLIQGITGASPETLGGMELLEANASSPLISIATNYDEVVAPMISAFYDWAMQSPDVSDDCKGDFQCRAIGASELIHRDRKAQAAQQVLVPMTDDPGFGLSKAKVGELVVRGIEIDPASVKMDAAEKQAMAEQPPPEDPRIAAANIKAQSDQAVEASRREDADLDRKLKQWHAQFNASTAQIIKEAELQIQVLESARDRDMTTEEIRATLADSAMKIRAANDRFQQEMQFAITKGQGRGL